jgi:hypothetical protein
MMLAEPCPPPRAPAAPLRRAGGAPVPCPGYSTASAAEPCLAGLRERADGGYRVLNWEAVEGCLDRVREIRGEDAQADALERDREAQSPGQDGHGNGGHSAVRGLRNPPQPASSSRPGHLPAQWKQWPSTVQGIIVRQRQPGQWYLLFSGVVAGNGYGHPVDAS